MIKSARVRVFLGLVIGIASLVVLVGVLQRRSGYYRTGKTIPASPPTEASTTPTADKSRLLTSPQTGDVPASPTPLPEESASPNLAAPPVEYLGTLKLIIPVAGVRPNQLQDTFADSRSEGRVHDAIDIPAPAGTPVLAAADGEILKLFQSEPGGTTIYHLSTDKKLVFYYAHIQRYADGLFAGKFVRQGEVIAYVGDTGNAGPGNYHLHFSIAAVADPKRYWEGANINPYPLLRK